MYDPADQLAAVPRSDSSAGTDEPFFDEFLARVSGNADGDFQLSSFTPATDIYEDDQHLTLTLEVPGVSEKDINITLEGHTLTVSGERKPNKEQKRDKFHRAERFYGTFSRSFTLPNTVDPNSIHANYDNGIFQLQMAKRAEAKPKQIKMGIGQKQLSAKAA
ncbi:MAG TPA: Hsp20/alpha crystallin family protein [Terriglobales bacterium]|nr:Hsp20/alpha crystallin family protein [Terriglobales bacterium]